MHVLASQLHRCARMRGIGLFSANTTQRIDLFQAGEENNPPADWSLISFDPVDANTKGSTGSKETRVKTKADELRSFHLHVFDKEAFLCRPVFPHPPRAP